MSGKYSKRKNQRTIQNQTTQQKIKTYTNPRERRRHNKTTTAKEHNSGKP
jgi:hypothetical protein